MTRWTDEQESYPRVQQSLGADLIGLSPASTMPRELLAAAWQITAVVLLCFVLFPHRLPVPVQWGLLAVAVIYFIVRFIIGLAHWSHQR